MCPAAACVCVCVQPNELRPSAAKAEKLLAEALSSDADIPLALHLYIHISEASTPNRWPSAGHAVLLVHVCLANAIRAYVWLCIYI